MRIFDKTNILLPEGVDMHKWSVVACDQYTSQPEYWERVRAAVGTSPSTLNIVYPEAFLSEGDARISEINKTMKDYIDRGLFAELRDSLIYVERQVNCGKVRRGLVGAVDLEGYDFAKGSKSEIRATEGTVPERIPPRVKIRENAPLELPHAILLINDSENLVLSGIDKSRPLYDFDLCEGGGHISGWRLKGEEADMVLERLDEYASRAKDNLIFAVGDGNHSLAAAKVCWENVKKGLRDSEKLTHPARFCLVEIENIYDEALEFEPIHRVVFGEKPEEVSAALKKYYDTQAVPADGCQEIVCVFGSSEEHIFIKNSSSELTVGTLQKFIDDMGYNTDYIHGEDIVRKLAKDDCVTGFLLPAPNKADLFETVISDGALPRKTFSMGEANEKRFYLEAKKIK